MTAWRHVAFLSDQQRSMQINICLIRDEVENCDLA